MIPFNFPILKNKFKQNSKVRKKLLELIDKQESGELKQNDDYYTDSISKVDWDKRHDTEREWVKLVGPYLQKHFTEEVKKIENQRNKDKSQSDKLENVYIQNNVPI